MRVAAIIPAAGRGERLGAPGPKAFVPLAGRPLVGWCLDVFDAMDSIDEIVIAAPPGDTERMRYVCAGFVRRSRLTVVVGGESRSASVRNALSACATAGAVVVHDAARPLVSADLVEGPLRQLAGAPGLDAIICASSVTDTIKAVDTDGVVNRTVDRSALRAVQTPQVFRRSALGRALAAAGESGLAGATDDASLVERAGGTVAVHESPPENIKVTTPFDLSVAERLLSDRVGGGGGRPSPHSMSGRR